MDDAFVVQPGEGRVLDLGTFQAVVLAPGTSTGGAFTLLQTQHEPHGFGPPMHVHRAAAEAFYVLEGEYLMHLDDRAERCPPGTFVYVPAGMPHTFQVVSATPGKKLNLFSPAAMETFFEELAAADDPDEAALAAIAERAGMDVVGPVPEGYL
jgi:mannose-6-phosphate isomerase-like protein (cupin superfamily)